MNKYLLSKFKSYISSNYADSNLTASTVCAHLQCSQSYLNELIKYEYQYSHKKYIEYFRILKAIELVCTQKTTNIYIAAGYNSSSVFSKAFLRITGFHFSCFYDSELKEYQDIISGACIAAECPKKAIQLIANNSSIRAVLSKNQTERPNKNKIFKTKK